MRTIYCDPIDFKCYASQNADGTLISVETEAFDGKCDAYIEGCRLVPEGKKWTREDGEVFIGEMKTLWKDSRELDTAQRGYEREQLSEYEKALAEIETALGV